MNYYNPYFYNYPTAASARAPGLFRSLFKGGINWGSVLTNTQRTIGLVNQAIPMFKQMSPMVKNAKTMFRVMNEFKKVEPSPQKNNTTVKNASNIVKNKQSASNQNIEEIHSESGPQFFI